MQDAPGRVNGTVSVPGALIRAPELAAALDHARETVARILARAPSGPAAPGAARPVRRSGLDIPALSRFVRPAAAPGRTEPAPAQPTVYAVGDVHGCYALLTELLAKIVEDAAALGPAARPILVLCGDYVDRGEDSARVLETLTCLREWRGWEVRLLKGNHEQGLLRFLDEPAGGEPWIRFGGAATLRAYGVEPPAADAPPAAWVAARDAFLRRMPASHLRLLQSLELMAVIGDHAFVHAGVEPGTPLAQQVEGDLLWIRDEFLDANGPFEKIIVHGHSWIDDLPMVGKHRIGLDTGAYATGVLTAARLSGGQTKVIQARDASRPPWPRSERRRDGLPRLVAQPADYSGAAGETLLRVSSAEAVLRRPAAPQPELTGADLRFHKMDWR